MASAVTAKALPPPASPFASLLRRSKFTVHDPKIRQIYASFGGDAQRGNFGLKRPIPFPKRRPHITVSAVDSRENQTVWRYAEQAAKWIKMWDEVSVHVRPKTGSSWHRRLGHKGEVTWTTDSEFTRATSGVTSQPTMSERKRRLQDTKVYTKGKNLSKEDKLLVEAAEAVGHFAPTVDVENIHAMSEKDFQRYLTKMRELRPQFKQFIEVGEALFSNAKEPRSTYAFSQSSLGVHKYFLSAQAYKKYNSPDSQALQQQPHLNGGLTYAASSSFQTMYTRQPQPGRYVGADTYPSSAIVSFAGMTAECKTHQNVETVDWKTLNITGERDPSIGVSKFRLDSAEIYNVPRVVGPRISMMRNLILFTKVKDTEQASFRLANPHRPGSAEYIQHEEGVGSARSTQIYKASRYPTFNMSEARKSTNNTIKMLETHVPSDVQHVKPLSSVIAE